MRRGRRVVRRATEATEAAVVAKRTHLLDRTIADALSRARDAFEGVCVAWVDQQRQVRQGHAHLGEGERRREKRREDVRS